MKRGLKRQLALVCLLAWVSSCSVTPMPLSTEQVERIAEIDRQRIFERQESLTEALTLERAIAMALKYNLENRVRMLEETVAYQTFDLGKTEMLPQLAANAGYLERDRPNASFSTSIQSGNVSLEPSTSQDPRQENADIGFTWNLLDFGVSYLQAKQDADRYLVAQQSRAKVMLTLMQEVRGAYWKAVAMEAMKQDLERLSKTVNTMLGNLRTVREEQLKTPVAVLMDIRLLIETTQQLDQIRRTINTAQTRLATLVNVPSYSDLIIEVPDRLPVMPQISDDVESMELLALSNSADYTAEIYKVRIEQLESRKTLLRLLPGLEFKYTENFSGNSFLVNDRWNQVGVNLTGDLLKLAFRDRIDKFRETSEELSIGRKLAMNMAVVAGVHITWQDYQNALLSLERAILLEEIDAEISSLTRSAEVNRVGTGVESIQNELRAFRSRMSQMQSYADAQAAYGALMVSLGLNPIPKGYDQYSVSELAKVVTRQADSLVTPLLKAYEGPDGQLIPILKRFEVAPNRQTFKQEFMALYERKGVAVETIPVVAEPTSPPRERVNPITAAPEAIFEGIRGIINRVPVLPDAIESAVDILPGDLPVPLGIGREKNTGPGGESDENAKKPGLLKRLLGPNRSEEENMEVEESSEVSDKAHETVESVEDDEVSKSSATTPDVKVYLEQLREGKGAPDREGYLDEFEASQDESVD